MRLSSISFSLSDAHKAPAEEERAANAVEERFRAREWCKKDVHPFVHPAAPRKQAEAPEGAATRCFRDSLEERQNHRDRQVVPAGARETVRQ